MDGLRAKFDKFLSDSGYRHSETRDQVVSIFFASRTHIGIEELYQRVRKQYPKIGIATVYRTLNLLVRSGLALRRNFDTGAVTYEVLSEHHHDHLICLSCKRVVEFHDEEIENLQLKVAKSLGFVLKDHKMELYGLCSACKKNK